MALNKKILKDASQKAFDKLLKRFGYAVPSAYSIEFVDVLVQYGASAEDIKKVVIRESEESSDKFVVKAEEAIGNAHSLTSDSIRAIEDHDTKALSNILQKMADLKAELSEMKKEIYKDVLVNAKNKRWLIDHFLKYKKAPFSGAIAFVDMKEFKKINDEVGHAAGDNALKLIAASLNKLCADWNIVRYGGDEFVVVAKDTGANELKEKLYNLQQTLDKKLFQPKSIDKKFRVRFDFGVTEFFQDDEISNIMEAVDLEMYANKRERRTKER